MIAAQDLELLDGRHVQVHHTNDPAELAVFWHHGSPQTGALLEPLVTAAEARAIRVVSYGRPSYGGSTPRPGRDVASAADDVRQIADALGIARFAVIGASGGGPHALACAALLPERVTAAACLAGIAPLTDAFDWFAGMVAPGGLRAAQAGRAARARFAETDDFDPASFVPADWAALEARWASLGADATRAGTASPDGLIDDDVAFVSPWGFALGQIAAPVLFLQGDLDRVVPAAHAAWMHRQCPVGELWLRPADGHISILDECPAALDWLRARSIP